LEIWSGNKVIFRSKKEGIQGLLEFIDRASIYGSEGKEENEVLFAEKSKRFPKNLIVFDKKVGNAVALLCAYLGVKEIYGAIGSELAKKTLKEFNVKYYFLKTIPNILNKDETDLCPMEKLSFSKTPKEFLDLLRRKNYF